MSSGSNNSGKGGGGGRELDLNRVELVACAQWWQRNCREFSLWFLSQSPAVQEQLILSKCPSIRRRSSLDASDIPKTQLTDLVLSELVLEDLLAAQGKILILLLTRRLAGKVGSFTEDLQTIKNLRDRNMIPSIADMSKFHADSAIFQKIFKPLVGLENPFIDQYDLEERVMCMDASQQVLQEIDAISSKSSVPASVKGEHPASESSASLAPTPTPPTVKEQLDAYLATGRLVAADIWIWSKLRSSVFTSFFIGLMEEFQLKSSVKPSPTIQALIRGEAQQEDAFL